MGAAPAGTLAVGDIAHISVEFAAYPNSPGYALATVTYELPQQYFIHILGATDRPPSRQDSYAFSPKLALSGKWVIPLALAAGDALEVKPIGCDGDPALVGDGTSLVRVTVPAIASASPYTATGEILDGSPVESKAITPDKPIYAQVPLGLELKIGIKKDGVYIPAAYQLSAAHLTGLAQSTLYPTNAVLEYGRTVHEMQKTFRGVHLGTQTLTVIPDGHTLPRFTFTLGVFDPGNMGNENQYDPLFIDWGNKRGIPPHILKGLVRQEGGFNPLQYRYEPISNTTGDRYIQSQLAAAPFSNYLLATDTGIAKGPLILDLSAGSAVYSATDDVSPRKIFAIVRTDGTVGKIMPLDECPTLCVSARQIFESNDDWQHWSSFTGNTDWWDTSHLPRLEFTAQTPEAASYGLMQTMFVRAMELDWATVDGKQNPSLLFDTAGNIAKGGGSVPVGTLEFYRAYRKCTTPDLATDPDFADGDAYKAQIIAALNWYNHGNARLNLGYGDNAWGYSMRFVPAHPLSKIFP